MKQHWVLNAFSLSLFFSSFQKMYTREAHASLQTILLTGLHFFFCFLEIIRLNFCSFLTPLLVYTTHITPPTHGVFFLFIHQKWWQKKISHLKCFLSLLYRLIFCLKMMCVHEKRLHPLIFLFLKFFVVEEGWCPLSREGAPTPLTHTHLFFFFWFSTIFRYHLRLRQYHMKPKKKRAWMQVEFVIVVCLFFFVVPPFFDKNPPRVIFLLRVMFMCFPAFLKGD